MKTLKMVFLMVVLSLFVNGVVFAMVNIKGSWTGEIHIPPDFANDLTVQITTQDCDTFRGTVSSNSFGISGKISGRIFSIMNQLNIINFTITITSPCSGAFTGKAILNRTGTRKGFPISSLIRMWSQYGYTDFKQLFSGAGSNGWALGPSKTASGNAMLLANPHLHWAGKYTSFEAQLTAPGINAYGATLVGFPLPVIAFNDSAAGRDNLRLAVSADAGVSWTRVATIEDAPDGNFSYPDLVRAREGSIRLVYTWQRRRIAHVVLNEAWLTARLREVPP